MTTMIRMLFVFLAVPASAQEAQEAKTRAGIAVWDTGQSSAEALPASALAAKSGWISLPQGQLAASFKGDAVLTNGPILAVLRKQDSAIEIHAVGAAGSVLRARLVLQAAGGEAAAKLDRLNLLENDKGSVSIEAGYKTAKGVDLAARFRLKRGDLSVETQPGPGAWRLRVECSSRFVVLPDFFADDMLFDARKFPIPAIEIPSENFLLLPAGKGDCLAMAAFENREQDVRVTLAGEGEQRQMTGAEIQFGTAKANKVWLTLLEGPGMWHAVDVGAKDSRKVVPLDWTMPFTGQWRCDFMRENDLTDSWELLLQETKDGEYLKPEWMDNWSRKIPLNRERWNPMLGRFSYPAWTDHERKGFLQPFNKAGIVHRGPVLIYPIHRIPKTPPESFTVVDAVRNTMGVGPCQHLLDLEGQKDDVKGQNTCSVRDTFAEIWGKGEQKAKRDEVEKCITNALDFVTHIRQRIALYMGFSRDVRTYLAEQKKARPELEKFLGELEEIVAQADARYAAREEAIKTPAYVKALNDGFRKDVKDYEGPDAAERCKKYTAALVEVGDNQDELSGELRWIVKNLRQKAGIVMALDPRATPVCEEIRQRTQKVLRSPAGLERAHH
jgi:hypothetical protein